MYQINGVYCAVLTPINADLSINNDLYLRHCQFLMKKGLDGLTPFGTNGEASSFSINQKKESLEFLLNNRIDPKILIPDKKSSLPKKFEVVCVEDLGARFQGAKTFVQDTIEALPGFYSKVGQSLKAWVPKPPEIKADDEQDVKIQNEKEVATQINETQYYYFVTGAEKQVGPVGELEIRGLVEKTPQSDVRVWHEGLTSWVPFNEVF